MKRNVALLALGLSILAISVGRAEVFLGIEPSDSLAGVRKKFPAGKFETLHPAWAQASDVLYELTGQGIDGSLILKFQDNRPSWTADAEKAATKEEKAVYESMSRESDEDALSIEWVRWIPSSPLPLSRFTAKYGKGFRNGFRDDNMKPYREWPRRGVVADLTDDGKHVTDVEFVYTANEIARAWTRVLDEDIKRFKEETTAEPSSPKEPAAVPVAEITESSDGLDKCDLITTITVDGPDDQSGEYREAKYSGAMSWQPLWQGLKEPMFF